MGMKTPKCVLKHQEKAFNKLVELHDGDSTAAFDEYEKNGRVVPDRASALVEDDILDNRFTIMETIETDPTLLAREKVIAKTKAILAAKLAKLKRLAEKDKSFIAGRDEIQAIYNQIDVASTEESLVDFIIAADNMTKTAQKWLDKFKSGEKEPTLDKIKKMQDYVQSLSVLKELSLNMFENEENHAAFAMVESIIGRYESIHSGYITLARSLITKSLSPNFHKIYRLHEKKAEQVFNRTFKKGYAKSEQAQAKDDFVNKYMIDNATAISLETENYVQNMMIQTMDVPSFLANFLSPKDLNNDIMNVALESIDKADMEVWQKMIEVTDDSDRINEAFTRYVGKTSDSKKQYDILLARDGQGNVIPEIVNRGTFGYKEFVEMYKDVPEVWDMYEHLEKLVLEKNSMVFNNSKLDYRLPYIEQSGTERLASQGLLSFVKNGITDNTKLKGKDVESGLVSELELDNDRLQKASLIEDVYVTEAGEERGNIPLHYRNSNIDPNDQTYDVITSIVLDYHNSLKFKAKIETAVFLDVLKDVVNAADINQVTSFGLNLKFNKATGEQHSKKGDSVLGKSLEALIRHRIYDIAIEGDPKATKILKSIGKYTSFATMAGNWVSGAVNLFQGATVGWIETAGKESGYYTTKNRASAMIKYDSDLHNMVADAGNITPKSRTNLIMRYLNIHDETSATNNKSFAQNNQLKRVGETSAIMMANTIGDHALTAVTMYAVLDNNKVKDVNGNFLDKEFNVTTDRNKAIGFDQAMIIEDGKVSIHPSVDSTERTKSVRLEDMVRISNMVQRVTRDIYGNYSQKNKSLLQRGQVSHLFFQMRGWMPSGFAKRWRGFGSSGLISGMNSEKFIRLDSKYHPENIHKLSYNPHSDEFEQGQYVTALAYIRESLIEVRALKSIVGAKETWDKMDDYQKSNVKKTIIEFALVIGFFALSNAFDDDDEDPNDMENIYAAYITRRMYSELFSFAHPGETLRTFRSPAVALNSIEQTLDLIYQMHAPMELYDGGRHSGDSKLFYKFKKLVPLVKQADRNIEDSYQFLKK